MDDFCVSWNEPSDSTTCGEFLNQLTSTAFLVRTLLNSSIDIFTGLVLSALTSLNRYWSRHSQQHLTLKGKYKVWFSLRILSDKFFDIYTGNPVLQRNASWHWSL